MPGKTILVVDDEKNIVHAIQGVLEDEGYSVRSANCGESAIESVGTEIPDLVLLDIWMPGIDGLETLKLLRAAHPDLVVIMISGHGTIETAVKAIRLGAINFIEKPLSLEKLVLEVEQALKQKALEVENRELKRQIAGHRKMVGHSRIMAEIRELIKTAGPTNGRVLIHGESGTGKELVAREIHEVSLRASAPFVEVNCAAIPEDLIESELFGHEKGAFTNATFKKSGKFELAHRGTIFLDEVGDMSLKTQAKVLRVLEEGKIERVGGSRSISVDVRVIAASNKNLEHEIEKNLFREDLYYRLNVIPISIPPLRNRQDDISDLVEYYLEYFCAENGKPLKNTAPDALKILLHYGWPGNIRELKNEVERLVILAPGNTIKSGDLRESLRNPVNSEIRKSGSTVVSDATDLKAARESFEKQFILNQLNLNHWNITQTSEQLGIERSNLHRKIKQLGLSSSPDSGEVSP